MLHRAWPALLFGALAACGSGEPSLSVDLRTDFIPGTEFDGVTVRIGEGVSAPFVVLQDQDFVRGVRVGNIETGAGTQTVTLELIRAGEVLVERVATAAVAGDTVVQLVVSRDCRDVQCGASLSCRGGACVDLRCTATTPEYCPDAECATAAECATPVDCATSACASGVCLVRPDDARCGSGACDLMMGCVGAPFDGGVSADAGVDAGVDARVDVSDAGTDAPEPDGFTSGGLCPERFERTTTCDVLQQTGCDPGESCLPSADDASCRAHGDRSEGEVCSRGECGLGLRCWRQPASGVDRCSRICTTPHDCTCGANARCVPLEEAPFGACMNGASCDPVANTGCGAGQTCYLSSFGPACTAESGSLMPGAMCDESTDCEPGYSCANVLGMGARCRRVCELSDVVTCICTNIGFSDEYGYCQ
ncbi:MAG: hypothetical protein AB8H86_21010 [Polyangiales bacterium]